MRIEEAKKLAKEVGGLWIPATETHFVEMMSPKAKRHMVVDGKVAYQGHKWKAALELMQQHGTRMEGYVDIGAHAGLWAYFLTPLFMYTTAFEPAPLHAALFRLNMNMVEEDELGDLGVDLDGEFHRIPHYIEGRLELIECALGVERGLVTIECAADETGSAHVAQGDGGDKRRGHGELVQYPDVPMLRLDEFGFTFKADLVKIDVEGFEENVVRGGEQFFKAHRPWVVVEQKGNDTIYGGERGGAFRLLQSWGWRDAKVISGDHIMQPPK